MGSGLTIWYLLLHVLFQNSVKSNFRKVVFVYMLGVHNGSILSTFAKPTVKWRFLLAGVRNIIFLSWEL